MKIPSVRLTAFFTLCTLVLAACKPANPPEVGVDHASISNWRVVIELPDVTLPVGMYLEADGSRAWFTNAAERVDVPEITRHADGFTLRFPAFNNTIELNRTEQGYEGSLTLVKRGYEQVMPLTAAPDPGFRFTDEQSQSADFTGRWEVGFIETDGSIGAGVGEIDQQGNVVSGTFLTPVGDYRYLEGNVIGQTMTLSTFDGAHAFVFSATMQADGSIEGDFWSGTKWHQEWTANRNFNASLPDAYELTYLNDGYDRLEFSFPDLEGTPVSLADEKYQGKVVLVTLGGTWCPNCADEMEFLSGVYKQYADQGLEIICLLYEHFEEFDLAAQQGMALVKKHDIGFDVLVAGISDKQAAAETLPMLNHVLAFPTLIFVDREGQVRRIHTGFAGPGTGQYFETFKQEFSAELESLLSES